MNQEEIDKWVYIGEVEMKEPEHYNGRTGWDICPDGNGIKYFLLKRNYEKGCMYSILSTRKKKNHQMTNPVFLEEDMSIFAILTYIVSAVYYPMFRDVPVV